MAVFNLTPADNIQDVIDNVNPGDTINLGEGTYNQSIIISMGKDCIRIVGAGIGKTILDGTELGIMNGIEIDSFMVTIEKLTVQNFGDPGIFIQKSENIINQVKSQSNQNNGMVIASDAERNLIIESEANFNANPEVDVDGIQVNGDHNYIVKCKFNGNSGDGLDLNSSNNFVFLNCAKENGVSGFNAVDGNVVNCNLFICNQAIKNGTDGFIINNTSLLLWNKTLCNSDDGIEAVLDNNLLWGNEVKENNEDGIDVNSTNSRIIRNKVVKNGIKQNDRGIEINGNANIVDNNCVENNEQAGIIADLFFDGNVIRSNRLRRNNPDIVNEGINTLFDDNKCITSDPAGLCQINNEVIVNEGESIQAAINAVTTTEGFTIRVGAGTFPEIINIGLGKDRIRIIGAGQGKTTIDGVGLGGIGINIDGSSFVTIENLTVQKCDSFGIRINTSDNILHCVKTLNNKDDGIRIEEMKERNIVMYCESSGNVGELSDGIEVNGNHNYVVCSQFNSNKCNGLLLFSGEFNLVLNSIFHENEGDGLLSFGNNNYFICNIARKNIGDGFDFESNELDDDNHIVLFNKACENADDGLCVCNNTLVWGNTCITSGEDGIQINNDNNRVIRNTIKNSVESGLRNSLLFNIIDNNIIVNNNGGILLQTGSDDNKVRSNCLTGNSLDIIDQGINNIIDENKCQTSIPDGLCEDC
ncbi:right-handed parallel beta-helix repeat-containing protein [Chengkuizengella sp. SCS-71B]|uniref:right-handed parallel beta-helix repeat-containing protein n=1 Tax=Chengkuizengella sp. SCS-71B TaxID=3115290 RepID=UPI0032C216D1